MTEIALYIGLFVSAFTSATLLPGSSEAALIAILVSGQGDAAILVAVATVGNVLGSLVNWVLGRFMSHFKDRSWFPVKGRAYERAVAWFGRYGAWSLLLSWVPVFGDPLTVAAGALRFNLLQFLILVSIGKAARYISLASAYAWWATW
jgi:membrane protein YqaA with SNARE-associated domain